MAILNIMYRLLAIFPCLIRISNCVIHFRLKSIYLSNLYSICFFACLKCRAYKKLVITYLMKIKIFNAYPAGTASD